LRLETIMIKRKSDIAYARLREKIVSASLPPGAPIDEQALMAEFGVGRTPLREAVIRLSQEGLISALAGRGNIVAETSPLDLFRAFELRRQIELLCASWAAERRTPADLDAFDVFIAGLRTADASKHADRWWNLEMDEEFHRLVAAAADNRFALDVLRRLFGLSVRSLHLSRAVVTSVAQELADYEAVFEAIRRRDAREAARAMGRHLPANPLAGLMADADRLSGLAS
jgi:DNA-binding GntR family transcriptional regulator